MADEEFKRIRVWGGWLRLSHLSIGLSTLLLLATGWLIAEGAILATAVLDVHYLAASLLLFGLVLRFVLMVFGQANERAGALIPQRSEWRAIGAQLLFYLSLGRAPLPRWYAHNPLWKLIYLLIFLGLAVLLVTGALMQDRPLIGGIYLPAVHTFWAKILLWISGLHILAVILHDLKGKGADVSGIINGYRLFFIDRDQAHARGEPSVQYVSMEELGSKDRS